jgi:hypothetical protein
MARHIFYKRIHFYSTRARCMSPTGKLDNPKRDRVTSLGTVSLLTKTEKSWCLVLQSVAVHVGGDRDLTLGHDEDPQGSLTVPETDKRYSQAVSLYRKRTKRYSQAVSQYRKRTNGTHKRYLSIRNGQTVLTSGISVPETDNRYSQAVSLYRKRTNGIHKRTHSTKNGQTVLTSDHTVPETEKRVSQSVSIYRKLKNGIIKPSHSFQKTKNDTHKEPCYAVFRVQVLLYLPSPPLLPPTLSAKYKIYLGYHL